MAFTAQTYPLSQEDSPRKERHLLWVSPGVLSGPAVGGGSETTCCRGECVWSRGRTHTCMHARTEESVRARPRLWAWGRTALVTLRHSFLGARIFWPTRKGQEHRPIYPNTPWEALDFTIPRISATFSLEPEHSQREVTVKRESGPSPEEPRKGLGGGVTAFTHLRAAAGGRAPSMSHGALSRGHS